jgi:hypothetical protein
MSRLEREPLSGNPTIRSHRLTIYSGRSLSWALFLGILLLIETLFLDQKDLQTEGVPIHIAMLGFLGAILFSGAASAVSPWKLWGIAGLGALLTFVSSASHENGLVLGAGWLALLTVSCLVTMRGGRR